MELDLSSRILRISVRQLAEFSPWPDARSGRPAPWRAEVGQQWHNALRQRTQSTSPDALFEVSISGILSHNGWQLHVAGRIDQALRPTSDNAGPALWTLREIKSVRQDLPTEPAALQQSYPQYFLQAALYQRLAGQNKTIWPGAIQSELVFVDIESGITQKVPVQPVHSLLLDEQIDSVIRFAESRRQHLDCLRNIDVRPPYAQWREGQPEVRQQLAESSHHRVTLLEAPTGFGKTGLSLEHALKALKNGIADRIIYLTGKHTGREPVQQQLATMLGENSGLRWFQLQNRELHRIEGFELSPEDRMQAATRWQQAQIDPAKLFRSGTIDLKDIRDLGLRLVIDPFDISRLLLPHADLWIADYNYVFHPRVRAFLENIPEFHPERTCLIIDEAHNLPARVADNLSFSLRTQTLEALYAELQFTRFAGQLPRLLDRWIAWLDRQTQCDEMDPDTEKTLRDFFDDYAATLDQSWIETETLSDTSFEYIWDLREIARSLHESRIDRLFWIDRWKSCHITCLSAAAISAERLSQFQQSLLMSATLQPLDTFSAEIGMQNDAVNFIQGTAAWQHNAFTIAVDIRPDTRYRNRSAHLQLTAEAIANTARHSDSPVAAFFPSFSYAESVTALIDQCAPDLRAICQPRAFATPDDALTHLETSLLTADILCLVLGSRFSEGIDRLGGRVEHALVIGPALPEVNPLQIARMQRNPLHRTQAFREVYQIPAMRRVLQALGRLVRNPSHRVHIQLHCQRFADPSYQNLLPPHLRGGTIIETTREHTTWLTSPFKAQS